MIKYKFCNTSTILFETPLRYRGRWTHKHLSCMTQQCEYNSSERWISGTQGWQIISRRLHISSQMHKMNLGWTTLSLAVHHHKTKNISIGEKQIPKGPSLMCKSPSFKICAQLFGFILKVFLLKIWWNADFVFSPHAIKTIPDVCHANGTLHTLARFFAYLLLSRPGQSYPPLYVQYLWRETSPNQCFFPFSSW